jgi:hypothetical protein
MSESIIDWLIWEIIKMKEDVSNHHHTSIFTPINNAFPNNIPNNPVTNTYLKIQHLKDKKKELEHEIHIFNDFKKKICTTPCPIEAMKKELNEIILQIPELEKKHLELIETRNIPKLRDKILDDLHFQFNQKPKE